MIPKIFWFGVLLLIAMVVEGEAESSNCLYQYIQQPKSNLNCNSYGSRLQLHCGVNGPLVPPFQLEWYSSTYNSASNSTVVTKLSSLGLQSPYHIQHNVMDVMRRSVLTSLYIEEINPTHSQTCFWCQIEFNGLTLPAKSSSLCIESFEYYTDTLNAELCSARDTVLIDTSIQCVNISNELVKKLERIKSEIEIHTSPVRPTSALSTIVQLKPTASVSLTPIRNEQGASNEIVTMFGTEAIVSGKSSVNIDQYSLHTFTPIAMSTFKTQVSATPSSTLSGISVSSYSASLVTELSTQAVLTTTVSIMDNSTTEGITLVEETVPRSSFEGALYAAIIVCILFVGVIVVLVVVVVCLMRKKCSCLEQAGLSLRQRRRSSIRRRHSQGYHVTSSDVLEQVDGSSTTESGIGSTHVEVSSLDRSRSFNAEDRIKPPARPPKKKSPERNFHRAASNEPLPPELPPKPHTKKSSTLPSKGYDHLEPVARNTNFNNHSFSSGGENNGYIQMDTSLKPAVPVISVPKTNHFYHELENTNDGSGLLRSASASHTSSVACNLEGSQNNVNATATRLKELFDDPRYAVLVLDSDEDQTVGGLTRRKDFSRSSPSIVTLLQPQDTSTAMMRGATERRSLRLPRWISTNKTRDIYDNA